MYPAQNLRKRIGIWLDHVQAVIVPDDVSEAPLRHVHSSHVSRVRIPGEGNDSAILGAFRSSTDESPKNERKTHDLHDFFAHVAEELRAHDDIYVFGPTTAPRELGHYLRQRKDFASCAISIESSDYITENQMRQQVQRHFHETSAFFN